MRDVTSIGIVDAAVKIGLGAFVAATGAFGLEVYRRRQDRVREQDQRYRENLEKPVVSFVDEALLLIARAYWNKADGKDSGVTALIEAFREKEATVEARLTAIGNPALSETFSAVDAALVAFRIALAEGSLAQARARMKEAQKRAGDLFRIVYGISRRGGA